MYTRYCTLKFEGKHLRMQNIQQYDPNKGIEILASNNDKFASLSFSWIADYSTGNE